MFNIYTTYILEQLISIQQRYNLSQKSKETNAGSNSILMNNWSVFGIFFVKFGRKFPKKTKTKTKQNKKILKEPFRLF